MRAHVTAALTPRPGAPLLPTGLAFPSAAFVACAAGRLATSSEGVSELLQATGVKLPLITQVCYSSPELVVAALLALALGVLALSHRTAPAAWTSSGRCGLRVACVLLLVVSLSLATAASVALPLAWLQATVCLQC